MDVFRYDFGYTWPWTYGHLIAAALFGLLTVLAIWLRWARWIRILGGAAVVWAIAGALITHGALRLNRPLVLPTDRFLSGGTGRVLDAGAGSGRSTLMVLLSRPGATVVALDIFS